VAKTARSGRDQSVTSPLTLAEREVLEFFVNIAKYLSLPRSVGEIYGLLFARGGKLTLDDLVGELGISKGSASQGLRMLRGVGGVRVSHIPGDRKDYFEAEAELPALIRGFLRDQLAVKMEHADERLGRLQAVVDDPANAAPDGLSGRVERLQSWHNKARRLVPLVSTFLKM
jgi:DNA-binding transcriptional regulator GbsR (MarR family)